MICSNKNIVFHSISFCFSFFFHILFTIARSWVEYKLFVSRIFYLFSPVEILLFHYHPWLEVRTLFSNTHLISNHKTFILLSYKSIYHTYFYRFWASSLASFFFVYIGFAWVATVLFVKTENGMLTVCLDNSVLIRGMRCKIKHALHSIKSIHWSHIELGLLSTFAYNIYCWVQIKNNKNNSTKAQQLSDVRARRVIFHYYAINICHVASC